MPDRGPDIDLHPYIRDPNKARTILDTVIDDCLSKGIFQFRVIHGKGKGHFRNLIHSHLEKNPDVDGFVLCDPAHGGSGSSWVHLSSDSIPDSNEKSTVSRHRHPYFRWATYLFGLIAIFLISDNSMIRIFTILAIIWIEFRLSSQEKIDN